MNWFPRTKQRTIERLWKEHKTDFLKLHALEQSRNKTIKDLEFAFTDLQGKSYYQFPQDSPMPTVRFGPLTDRLMWMDGGFHKKELLAIKEEIVKTALAATKNLELLGTVIALGEELGSRSEAVLHTELLYEIVAIGLVREDENPEVFNERIQAEKVKAFKEFVLERGSYFFFQKFPLKELKHLKEMSETEWAQYWHDSLVKQERTKELLKKMQAKRQAYSSKSESKPQGTNVN